PEQPTRTSFFPVLCVFAMGSVYKKSHSPTSLKRLPPVPPGGSKTEVETTAVTRWDGEPMPPESRAPDGEQIDQNLVRALGHPMRVQILEALQGRSASPTELARKFRESLGVVSYHANALLDV